MQARPVQNHKHHSNDDTKPHRTVTTANICVHIHTAVHRLALSSLCDRQTDRQTRGRGYTYGAFEPCQFSPGERVSLGDHWHDVHFVVNRSQKRYVQRLQSVNNQQAATLIAA